MLPSARIGLRATFTRLVEKNAPAAHALHRHASSDSANSVVVDKKKKNAFLSILDDIEKIKAEAKAAEYNPVYGCEFRLPQREAAEREKNMSMRERCLDLFAIKYPAHMPAPNFNLAAISRKKRLLYDDELIRSIENRVKNDPPVLPYFTHVTSTRNLPTSTFNLNKLARQIKGLSISNALEQMHFSPKKLSTDVAELLRLTIDDIMNSPNVPAEVKGEVSAENLIVARAWVGKGIYEKVICETSRWGLKRFRKRWAHLNVMVMLAPVGTIKPNMGNIKGKRPPEMRRVPKVPEKVLPILSEARIGGKKLFYDA